MNGKPDPWGNCASLLLCEEEAYRVSGQGVAFWVGRGMATPNPWGICPLDHCMRGTSVLGFWSRHGVLGEGRIGGQQPGGNMHFCFILGMRGTQAHTVRFDWATCFVPRPTHNFSFFFCPKLRPLGGQRGHRLACSAFARLVTAYCYFVATKGEQHHVLRTP